MNKNLPEAVQKFVDLLVVPNAFPVTSNYASLCDTLELCAPPTITIGDLRALVEYLKSEPGAANHQSGWQPIATAPSDGCQALAWDSVYNMSVTCVCSVGSKGFNPRYTHWHPLPEPPQQQARTSTIPEEIKAVESEIDWASYKLSRDPFGAKQSAYDPVKQKWVSHIGPFPAGYQVAAEHVGWLSFCEGVEYGKQLKP